MYNYMDFIGSRIFPSRRRVIRIILGCYKMNQARHLDLIDLWTMIQFIDYFMIDHCRHSDYLYGI